VYNMYLFDSNCNIFTCYITGWGEDGHDGLKHVALFM
jgi:hypothetical protein